MQLLCARLLEGDSAELKEMRIFRVTGDAAEVCGHPRSISGNLLCLLTQTPTHSLTHPYIYSHTYCTHTPTHPPTTLRRWLPSQRRSTEAEMCPSSSPAAPLLIRWLMIRLLKIPSPDPDPDPDPDPNPNP